LSIEEFGDRVNNFPVYFVDAGDNLCRGEKYFEWFRAEHGDFEKRLTGGFTSAWLARFR
jgi:hypothetical protein